MGVDTVDWYADPVGEYKSVVLREDEGTDELVLYIFEKGSLGIIGELVEEKEKPC